ncbi:MAG: aspartate-semialdehyde dehydrogenase [Candidatus Micrarchaeia archaeon]
MKQQKKRAAILGATGMVGQRFVRLLENHPQFEIAALCASSNSAGKKYADACRWLVEGEMPQGLRGEKVLGCTAKDVQKAGGADVVFSALPGDAALVAEPDFARAGMAVVSKASAFRMEPDVPLIIPEVNPEHLGLIERQRKTRKWRGFISTDPNCSTLQLAIALKPLHDEFGVRRVFVSTMQALSGAGYPGVPGLDIADNAIPFISGEEEKIEEEIPKLFGSLRAGKISGANVGVSANCCRINVREGHLESAFVELEREASAREIAQTLEKFKGASQSLKLFSAPRHPITVRTEDNRPQPRLDRDAEGGMSVSVGRIRANGTSARFFVLGHNTIRGAAGNGVLHAELLLAKGYL